MVNLNPNGFKEALRDAGFAALVAGISHFPSPDFACRISAAQASWNIARSLLSRRWSLSLPVASCFSLPLPGSAFRGRHGGDFQH